MIRFIDNRSYYFLWVKQEDHPDSVEQIETSHIHE